MAALATVGLGLAVLCTADVRIAANNKPQLVLELRLAADPERRGPTAWTMVREQLLPQLPGWPRGIDPLAALELRLELPFRLRVKQAAHTSTPYLRAQLRIAGVGQLSGVSTTGGGERFWGLVQVPREGRIAHLLRMLPATSRSTGDGYVARFDTAPWIGHLDAGYDRTSPTHGVLLMLGSVAGQARLELVREHRGNKTYVWATGHGTAGLLLPMALALAVDLRGRPNGGSLTKGPVGTQLDRWELWSYAGDPAMRRQALAQLATSDDPRAARCLEDHRTLRQLQTAGFQPTVVATERPQPSNRRWLRGLLWVCAFPPLLILLWFLLRPSILFDVR